LQHTQGVEHCVAALLAARGNAQFRMVDGQLLPVGITVADGHHHPVNLRMVEKTRQGMLQYRPAVQFQILLRPVRLHPLANPRRRNHRPVFLYFSHKMLQTISPQRRKVRKGLKDKEYTEVLF